MINESISDFKVSSLTLHGCSATQFNALGSISEILPILLLPSLLPKRTWVDFSNFADYVFAQRLVSTHFY